MGREATANRRQHVQATKDLLSAVKTLQDQVHALHDADIEKQVRLFCSPSRRGQRT